ncbi:unnamed protein product [Blepharisma stoltei]|uniref:Uncharacterized protein n=1 Tax=Blepharisma stoltei TaxID=1481888 RepID=A0AAU9J8H3_9CILI|nr:unnamed protein product [Blepharisma stoltei]
MENTITEGKERRTVSFIPDSKYVLYAKFATLEQAMEFPEEFVIDGQTVWMNHAGALVRTVCNDRGHNEAGHERVMAARCRLKSKKGRGETQNSSEAMKIVNTKLTNSKYSD